MLVDFYWLSPGVLGIDWHAKQSHSQEQVAAHRFPPTTLST